LKKNAAVKFEKHNGVVVPVGKTETLEQIAARSIETNALAEYGGDDLRFYGRNNIDVAIATLIEDATNGLPAARTELLDRVLGKPLQRQDIRSQNVTLVGFLDRIAEEEK
jgi:hypothetical protein